MRQLTAEETNGMLRHITAQRDSALTELAFVRTQLELVSQALALADAKIKELSPQPAAEDEKSVSKKAAK